MQTLTPNTLWSTLRSMINNNFSEVNQRLQAVEVIAYIRSGNGAPSTSAYNEGDFYIDKTTWNLYEKSGNTWTLRTNLIGPQGVQGGVGLTPRGVYNSATAYVAYDAVIYRGSYWRAIRANTNVEPTTDNTLDWERVAFGRYNAGAWATATMYRVGDVVTRLGSTYEVQTNHTSSTAPESTPEQYALLVSKGDQGIQGVQGIQGIPGLNPRGTWSSVTAYAALDAVEYRGSYWRALRSNTNVEPTTDNTLDWVKITHGRYNAGTWATATVYRVGDFVQRNGSIYEVLQNITSSTAPESTPAQYSLVVSKGDQGIQGNVGPTGPTGPINTVQNEGSDLTVRPKLNFVGAIVNAADDAANTRTNVTIKGYRDLTFYLPQAPLTDELPSGNFIVMMAGTIIQVRATVKVAPTGASLICELRRASNNAVIDTATIAAGTTDYTSGTLAAAVTAGEKLYIHITQIGLTIPGSKLTLVALEEV